MIDHKSPEVKEIMSDYQKESGMPALVLVPPQKKAKIMYLAVFVMYLFKRLIHAESIIKKLSNDTK